MLKLFWLILLCAITQGALAMNSTAQVITAGTAQGLVNAGIAVYMQKARMNPQFVNTPNGPVVVSGNSAQQPSTGPSYTEQNGQAQKQAFFNGH